MRISARCEYTLRALLELSLHWAEKTPLKIHAISEQQGIPLRYLVQILIQLKQMGYVSSTRGKEGGYCLRKSPGQIKLGDVICEVSGPLIAVAPGILKSPHSWLLKTIWEDVEKSMERILGNITFENLCDKVRSAGTAPMYQI